MPRCDNRLVVTIGLALTMGISSRGESPTPSVKSQLSSEEPDDIWQQLTEADGEGTRRAYRCMALLLQHPGQAVGFLKQRLQRVEPLDMGKVQRWLRDLDSNDFPTREQGTAELLKLGTQVKPWIEKQLAAEHPVEVRRRLERILEQLSGPDPPPEELRQSRAVEVLYQLGTPEARDLLEALSRGADDAPLTRDARNAVRLLTRPSLSQPARPE